MGEDFGQRVGIDAGHRDVGADAEDHERGHGEPQALLELGCLTDRAPVQVGCKLLGSGCHGTSRVTTTTQRRPNAPRDAVGLQAASATGLGGSSTLPPAFSTAAIADAEAPATFTSILVLISPLPRRRTPSDAFLNRPAACMAAASIVWPASSFLSSIAFCSEPRLTICQVFWCGGRKPRLGRRRCNGIWPPSKPLMETPVRDFWPFTPRPAVLPLPEPMPRPTRMRRLRAPALSAISLSFIVRSLSGFLGAHEVTHLVDHAAHRRRVLEDAAAVALVQPQALQRGELVVRAADRAAGLGDLDLLGLGHGRAP